ncbi:MAG: hypothetical protein ACFFC7_01385 [Candidatus Hermodarchaeota archaeon]
MAIAENPNTKIQQLLELYAQTRETSLLNDLPTLIFQAHDIIELSERNKLFELLESSNEKQILRLIFDWMLKNTPLKFIAIGDKWFLAKKKKEANSGNLKQKPENRLAITMNRHDHIHHMLLAAEEILNGEYNIIYKGISAVLMKKEIMGMMPNLSAGSLEITLVELKGEFYPDELKKLLYLGLILHDYGRLLKNKIRIDPNNKDPDANQHRIAGAYLVEDLLSKLGFDKFQTEIVKLLIKLHDILWNNYCLERDRDYNHLRTQKNVIEKINKMISDLKGTDLTPNGLSEKELKQALLKMIAVIGITDVHASGDRYLSDDFIDNVLSWITQSKKAI